MLVYIPQEISSVLVHILGPELGTHIGLIRFCGSVHAMGPHFFELAILVWEI